MSDSLRCFLAVRLPSQAIDRLSEAQQHLRQADDRWKWVKPESFHITLKFLGDVERERIPALWESIRFALAGSRVFRMSFRGLGLFPDSRAPRVAWAGIHDGATALTELAHKVEQTCAEHGFEPERRRFTAHLTLGRARRPSHNARLIAVIDEFADVDLGRADVTHVALMRSELTRAGAIYHVLEEHPLEPGEAE